MHLTVALLLCLGDTPEKTFEEIKKAALARDVAAILDAIAPFDRKEMDQEWAKQKERMSSPEGAEELKQMAGMVGVPEKDLLKLPAREFMAKMLAKMVERDPKSFDREFDKYKTGAIAGKKVEGDWCVLTVKSGDKEEEVEFSREGGKWYMSMAKQRRESNERNASARLKTIATAQVDFHAIDRDGDKIRNFWVKDIAGLYGIVGPDGTVKLLEIEVAQADRTEGRGKYPSVSEEKPAAGYHFAALKRYRENGKAVAYDDGKGHNLRRFGVIAWPAQYPQNGRLTFILNEQNTMFSKDTGGKAVDEYPEDPKKEGWKLVD